jgi:ABC-type taurine transport system substrate-binding protein
MTRPSITTQITAQAAVCAHLGTDLTMARANGLNIRWRGMESGSHVVTVGAKRAYLVDLVINSVDLRVGAIPKCCVGVF